MEQQELNLNGEADYLPPLQPPIVILGEYALTLDEAREVYEQLKKVFANESNNHS